MSHMWSESSATPRAVELVYFDVSGRRFSLSRDLVYKFPFSHLADISCGSSPSSPGFIDMDADVFAVIVNFLRYNEVHIPPTVSPAMVQRGFATLGLEHPNITSSSTSIGFASPQFDATSFGSPVFGSPSFGFSKPFRSLSTDDPIPSYEESIRSDAAPQSASAYPPEKASSTSRPADRKPQASSPQPILPAQIASVREHRIQTLLDTYVQPLLEEQGVSGLYKTTFILVPSNVGPLQPTSSLSNPNSSPDSMEGSAGVDTVVGFPPEEFVKLVRLYGPEHTLEFWRQPTVIDQLAKQLKARLYSGGHNLVHEEPESQADENETLPPMGGSTHSIFTRKGSERARLDRLEERRLERGLFQGGWRAPNEKAKGKRPGFGEVQVDVGVQDVSIRVVTEMGLYETRTGRAVVISIEVGG